MKGFSQDHGTPVKCHQCMICEGKNEVSKNRVKAKYLFTSSIPNLHYTNNLDRDSCTTPEIPICRRPMNEKTRRPDDFLSRYELYISKMLCGNPGIDFLDEFRCIIEWVETICLPPKRCGDGFFTCSANKMRFPFTSREITKEFIYVWIKFCEHRGETYGAGRPCSKWIR